MTRQMSAERTRRAVITEAQGQKEAAVTLAEGNRQAAILGAEGERQSAILRAEGLATGLEKISVVAEGLDLNTMQLKYLETLKDVGAGPSTKIVVPMELSGLIGGLRALLPQEQSAGAPWIGATSNGVASNGPNDSVGNGSKGDRGEPHRGTGRGTRP
jgi:regulator of protease activity HflC (stomatin/prohibitin superfamily)